MRTDGGEYESELVDRFTGDAGEIFEFRHARKTTGRNRLCMKDKAIRNALVSYDANNRALPVSKAPYAVSTKESQSGTSTNGVWWRCGRSRHIWR